jgi:phage/plasmid-like protein (TIGR03299 family)
MFYVGEEPWHGLGTKLNAPATASEAIKTAHLAWQVVKKPITAVDSGLQKPLSSREVVVPNKFAVVREDLWNARDQDCHVLGLVSNGYTPLQNEEAFAFFDPIVGSNAAVYETAGALGHGERVWMLAKLPTAMRVVGDDISNKYLLLSNSHDGTSSVQIKFTPIRVVCQNTLTMALKDGPKVRVAHTKDVHERLKNAHKMLGLIHQGFDLIEQNFRAMAKVSLTERRLHEYLELVFPDPSDPEDQQSLVKVQRDRAWSEYFFDQGKGNDVKGVAGTLWAAYNGVAEFVDHREIRSNSDRRLNSVWFGDGYLVKARSYTVALDQLKHWQN